MDNLLQKHQQRGRAQREVRGTAQVIDLNNYKRKAALDDRQYADNGLY